MSKAQIFPARPLRSELSLLSPSGRLRQHQKCTLVNCPPFGNVRSCAAKYFLQLATLISNCQTHFPSLSMKNLSSSTSSLLIEATIGPGFVPASVGVDGHLYANIRLKIAMLQILLISLRLSPPSRVTSQCASPSTSQYPLATIPI